MANTLHTLTENIGKVLATLQELFQSTADSKAFVNALGWELPPSFDELGLDEIDLTDFLNKLQVVLDSSEEEFEDDLLMAGRMADLEQALGSQIGDINDFAQSLVTVFAGFGDFVDRTQIHKELPRRILDLLVVNHVSDASPLAAALLHFLNLIEFKYFPADPANFQLEHVRAIVRYGNLGTFLTDPAGHMLATYGWGTPEFLALDLLNRIGEILRGLGITLQLQAMDLRAEALLLDQPVADPDTEPMPQMILTLYEKLGDIAGLKLGISVFAVRPSSENADDGGIGFLPIVRGEVEGSIPFFAFDDTFIDFNAEADLLKRIAFILRPGQDLRVKTANDLDDAFAGRLALGVRHGSLESDVKSLLTFPGGAGFQFQQAYLKGGLEKYSDRPAESFMELGLLGCRLAFALDEADGFLKKSISQKKIESPFDLRIGWNSESGIYFHGSSGLIVSLPVHLDVGPFDLTSLTLGLNIAGQGLSLESSVDGSLRLGPLHASVRRIGLEVDVTFEGGNLGLFNLSPRFKPPSGLGLSIDGAGFKGGGFLDFEPEQERYSGMLELGYRDQFTLKAFGLLTTRLPNGQSGFSLLIVISSEFTPIQLGFGFKLNGVGGLLGLNRTVKTEPLRAGLRDNTLGSILFPTDIIANADRILSDLRQVFPPQDGRFVFGPMAKITWGTPVLLTADLGLVIEVPDPMRLVILGLVRGILPDEKAAILRLQVNFLGEINFERQQLSFDASLFDSKLLAFTLTGDMALRLYWGADANFLLTVGGFHPAYQPPPMNLPSIRRLTLALLAGDNPRLRLETYFAVTSNTVQLGARLELYAAASKFNAYGFLSFDVLLQFNPFYFVADITAMLALRVGTASIAGIKMSLTLEGPTPWKARGTAKLRLFWFLTISVRFSKTFGEARNTSLPDLAVLPLLLAALSADDNWEGEFPARKHRLESFKDAAGSGQLIVHPLGTLKISQKIVPLNLRIDRLGSQRPGDGREFQIQEAQLAGTPVPDPAPAQESFAPAQFFDMTDEEKLASPSFKNFDGGIRIGEPERLHTAYAAAREVKYELKYIDSQRDRRLAGPKELFEIDPVAFNSWTRQGAVAKSELSFGRRGKSNLAPDEVAVVQEPFAIVNTGDLKLFDDKSLLTSERAALTRVKALLETNPALRGNLQVVPAFEMSS